VVVTSVRGCGCCGVLEMLLQALLVRLFVDMELYWLSTSPDPVGLSTVVSRSRYSYTRQHSSLSNSHLEKKCVRALNNSSSCWKNNSKSVFRDHSKSNAPLTIKIFTCKHCHEYFLWRYKRLHSLNVPLRLSCSFGQTLKFSHSVLYYCWLSAYDYRNRT